MFYTVYNFYNNKKLKHSKGDHSVGMVNLDFVQLFQLLCSK